MKPLINTKSMDESQTCNIMKEATPRRNTFCLISFNVNFQNRETNPMVEVRIEVPSGEVVLTGKRYWEASGEG